MTLAAGKPVRSFETLFESWRSLIDERLAQLAPPPLFGCEVLPEAWAHSVTAPGKRIRGLLLLSVLADFGLPESAGIACACALELVHTASLIIDDLPCMDDAELRRGRPTLHRRFGESAAILAAIAVLNEAFALAAAAGGIEIVLILTRAVGTGGLVGGQILDLNAQGDAKEIATRYSMKTSALFQASCEIAAVISHADDRYRRLLGSFADSVGLAFQIADDWLDVAGNAKSTGKDVGIDRPGTTLASVAGLTDTRRLRDIALRSARSNLTTLPRSQHTARWLQTVCQAFTDGQGLLHPGLSSV